MGRNIFKRAAIFANIVEINNYFKNAAIFSVFVPESRPSLFPVGNIFTQIDS